MSLNVLQWIVHAYSRGSEMHNSTSVHNNVFVKPFAIFVVASDHGRYNHVHIST